MEGGSAFKPVVPYVFGFGCNDLEAWMKFKLSPHKRVTSSDQLCLSKGDRLTQREDVIKTKFDPRKHQTQDLTVTNRSIP